MSKLLDLLAQQKALEEQINKLKEDAKEAKIFQVIEELEAIRTKYDYSTDDFVDAVLSYYRPAGMLKNAKNVNAKTPAAKKQQYKVVIDGVDVVLKESTRGLMKPELEKVVKAAGFEKYSEYLESLLSKNDVSDFHSLIIKLNGVQV